MAYYTIQTLRDRLGEQRFMALADEDRDGRIGESDEIFVQSAIDAGCSEIDSEIGTRHPVPLAAEHRTPALLIHALNCIVYHLSPTGDVVTESVEKRYRAALDWAKRVGCGKAQLGITEATPPQRLPVATTTHPTVSVTADPFSIVNMRGLG